MKKRRLLLLLLIPILALGVAAYDLSRLQSGFISPPDAVVEEAAMRIANQPPVPPIASYGRFSVTTPDGLDIAVYARESETASANLLLVHGAGGGAWVWEAYFAHLPDTLNLYALSWRGHFDSQPIPNANISDYVVDQTAVFQAIQGRNDLPIHLVGHSYGGAAVVLQAAQTPSAVTGLHLLAPVVPLNFSRIQAQLVPRVLSPIVTRALESGSGGSFEGMFVAEQQMQDYKETHADQPYSIEKAGLFTDNGFSPPWQEELAIAYQAVGDSNVPISWLIADYDNVVKPTDQAETATAIGVEPAYFESGHYLQLDWLAAETAVYLAQNINSSTD